MINVIPKCHLTTERFMLRILIGIQHRWITPRDKGTCNSTRRVASNDVKHCRTRTPSLPKMYLSDMAANLGNTLNKVIVIFRFSNFVATMKALKEVMLVGVLPDLLPPSLDKIPDVSCLPLVIHPKNKHCFKACQSPLVRTCTLEPQNHRWQILDQDEEHFPVQVQTAASVITLQDAVACSSQSAKYWYICKLPSVVRNKIGLFYFPFKQLQWEPFSDAWKQQTHGKSTK